MDRCGLISWDKYFKISIGSSFSVEDIATLSLITSLQGKERGIKVILFLMPKMLIEILVVEYEGWDHCGLKARISNFSAFSTNVLLYSPLKTAPFGLVNYTYFLFVFSPR